jgi:predicted DsbA family dithiol-disulfide isomerase
MTRTFSISTFHLLALMLAFEYCPAHAATPVQETTLEIDGKVFSAAELQKNNLKAVFQARNALFEAEKKATDEFINQYVLERQATKENLTVEQLLEKHVWSTLPADPSDEGLRAYYDGLDTPESFEAVKDKIRDHIRDRRKAKAKTAYVQALREKARISLWMAPPRAPIAVGDAPVRGDAGSPVTVIEYADYECPYCQQIKPVVDRITKEYKGRITFAFKDVPLPMHANAQKAAEAAHCAGAQGKFWEYHDRLFATKQFAADLLKQHAQVLALDQAAFDRCLESGTQAQRIREHVNEAQSIGLPGTPGFFVNGRFLNGAVDYQTLRKVIEEELKLAGAGSAQQTATVRQGGQGNE